MTKIGTDGEYWHITTQKVENSDKNVKGNTQAQDKYALQVWSVCSKENVTRIIHLKASNFAIYPAKQYGENIYHTDAAMQNTWYIVIHLLTHKTGGLLLVKMDVYLISVFAPISWQRNFTCHTVIVDCST